MRVLIIGGTGFIGSHVVRRLHHLGHAVTVFHRGHHETNLPSGVRHVHGQLPNGLRDFSLEGPRSRQDVVLYMVPIGSEDTHAALEVVRGITSRVVAISSIDVYRAYGRLQCTEPGPPDPIPLAENAQLRQRLYPYRSETPRSRSDVDHWKDDYEKILVERAVMSEADLSGTILRLPMVYGPGDPQHRLFGYIKRMEDRRPAIILDEGTAAWRSSRGYVENVAAAIALAVVDERAQGRIYNVGEDHALSEAEWVRAIGSVGGWPGDIVTAPRA